MQINLTNMNKFHASFILLSFGFILLSFNIPFEPLNSEIVTNNDSQSDLVSNYYFYQNFAGYNSIPSGTIIATGPQDDSTFGNIPIGFTFSYNSVNYTVVGVSANGWIQPGAVSPPAHFVYPMICSTYVSPVICAFNADLLGNVTDTLRYLTTGSAPNRVFTIEWCHWGFRPYGNNEMNFEIKLFEGTNIIQFIYQPLSPVSTSGLQVGLLGQSTSDYFTRSETYSWASTTVGTSCANCSYSSVNYPSSGLTFIFSPNPMGVDPKTPEIPKEFRLYNNFPNPFNPSSIIRFDVPKSSFVKLNVFNAIGEEVMTLADGIYPAGQYSVSCNLTNYPSGVYFYRLRAAFENESAVFTETRRMVLVK